MSGPFDFMHLKGHTEGSPNELSFDVLDAASRGMTEKKGRSKRAGHASKRVDSSFHGAKGASTLSAMPEVERRKRARRARTVRLWVVGTIALVAVLSLIGYASYSFHKGITDFNSSIDSLLTQIDDLDGSLVEVDALMKDPFSAAGADKRRAAMDAHAERKAALAKVAADAGEAADAASLDSEIAAFSQVESAAEARMEMLEAANGLFALAATVNDLQDAANDAWDKALEGDALAREATELANNASTMEATQAARQKTSDARDAFTAARDGLAKLEDAVEGLSYTDELAYLDKRIEALDAALATADALASSDRDAATQQNNAYNRADQEATVLAQALTGSVDKQIEEVFADEIQGYLDSYESARAEASTVDAALRRLR